MLLGQLQMPLEGLALALGWGVVAVVVQARFADRDHLGRSCQLGDGLKICLARLGRRIGVNANRGAGAAQSTRKINRGAAADPVVANQHHARDTRVVRSGHHLVAIEVECGFHQVGVRVDQPVTTHPAAPGTGALRPPTTSVNSPRGGCCSKCSSAACAVPRKISSKRLVSSRATATGRSGPRLATRSLSAATTRYGDSNTTRV